MTQRECYEKMGADYNEILLRLKTEERIDKYLRMFLLDESMSRLEQFLEEERYRDAYIVAHTLKSVTANLALTELNRIAVKVTDDLNTQLHPEAELSGIPELKKIYIKTQDIIRTYEEDTDR